MSIKLEHVTYTYNPGTVYEMHALKDVSFEIPQGQFVGIIGHTGSGKSTLIQHLNGLIRPTSGKVEDVRGMIVTPPRIRQRQREPPYHHCCKLLV